jgi:hypothetical protein
MSLDLAPAAPPSSRPLYRLIRRTRLLLRATRVLTGLALAAGLFLGALALVVAVDLLLPLLQIPFNIAFNLDYGLRLASLALVVLPPAAALMIGVAIPLFRRFSAGYVARRIEAHIPGIHNRLVSCIDLEARGRAAASPVFYRRLLTESLDRIHGFRPRRVLDFVKLRRAGLIAVAGALAFALVWCLFSKNLPTAMARIFHPFEDIPPVAGVAYAVEPEGGAFLREDKIDFAAHVAHGETNALTLALRAGNGAALDKPLEQVHDDPSLFSLQLDTVSIGQAYQNGFHYRVHGGGTWSPRYDARLVERPLVTNVDTAVFYPPYMAIPEAHPTPREAAEIIGPEGGEIEVAVQAEGQVAVGEIQLLTPGKRSLTAREQVERVWFEDKAPAEATEGGTWNQIKKEKRSAHTEPYAIGEHGHWFQGDAAGFAVQPGDVLFTYVFIDPQTPPEEILLQWNDGTGWEHGATWGADLIHQGRLGAASRRLMGKQLPAGGQWVRLEVPAKDVDLEGKTIHGMAFKLSGGQCWWGKSGAVRTEEPPYLVEKTYPMHSEEAGRWTGRLPLVGKGLFRAEMRNKEGHANKPMAELHYTAVKDQPPQVVLQRPGAELTLSEPQAPPLTIAAFDDYGLKDVTVFYRDNDKQPYRSRILRHFDRPERNQNIVAPLQEAAELKQGGALHYYIQASDRKDQKARTPEYVVRISADANAADKQEAAFDKTQDTFRDRLLKLISEQKKVQTKVVELDKQYAETAEKARKEQAAAPEPPPADPKAPTPPPPMDGPKLDPETAKQLAELEKQLADLAKEENKNAEDASHLNGDLTKANTDAEKLQTLPPVVAAEMRALQKTFEQTAVKGMKNLGEQFNQGANPKAEAPDLKDLKNQTDRLAKDLEGVKDRMEALDNARKGLRDDLAKALRDLQREMLNENGKLSERDLQELRDFIARMREQLKDFQSKQEKLLDTVEKGGDLKDVEHQQADLDKQLDKMLDAARKMLAAKRKPNRRKPTFPDEPYTPDDEVKVPPKDDDTNEPLPNAKKPDGTANPDEKKPDAAKDDDEEALDMPALGGPKQVPDKRFDKKKRPVAHKPGDKDDLESHQNDRLRDLDAAEKSLASDQQTLEKMLQGLEDAMKANGKEKGKPGQPNEADDAMQQLQNMLESPALREARAMLQRMHKGQASKSKQPANQPPTPSQSETSQSGSNPPVGAADLSKLSPAAREAVMKLSPRLREELLQGLREQGPEGYGPFIEDYFKRLTETKKD